MTEGEGEVAAEETIPPWVTFILNQVGDQFSTLNKRIDDMVTRDAFQQEQSRVNEKFEAQGKEIGDLKVALQAEATARVTAERALSKEREEERKEREKEQANRRWLVFGMIATPFVSAFVIWLLSGGLQGVVGP